MDMDPKVAEMIGKLLVDPERGAWGAAAMSSSNATDARAQVITTLEGVINELKNQESDTIFCGIIVHAVFHKEAYAEDGPTVVMHGCHVGDYPVVASAYLKGYQRFFDSLPATAKIILEETNQESPGPSTKH